MPKVIHLDARERVHLEMERRVKNSMGENLTFDDIFEHYHGFKPEHTLIADDASQGSVYVLEKIEDSERPQHELWSLYIETAFVRRNNESGRRATLDSIGGRSI